MTSFALLLRSTAAFLVLPGIVAYLIPLVVLRASLAPGAFASGGVALVCVGTALLLWCVREFHARGRGTLAPWDPPVRLVRTGLYQRSRNPMYAAVLLIVVGWAIGFASLGHAIYAAVVAGGFQLRVMLHEEPFLARTYGDEWTAYAARVPRWLL
jgi:protein-S-isoprenylcysteine O-methyltransferase Ste14